MVDNTIPIFYYFYLNSIWYTFGTHSQYIILKMHLYQVFKGFDICLGKDEVGSSTLLGSSIKETLKTLDFTGIRGFLFFYTCQFNLLFIPCLSLFFPPFLFHLVRILVRIFLDFLFGCCYNLNIK